MSTQYIGLKLGSINTTIFKPGNGLVLKEASMIAMPTNPKNKDVYAVGDNAKKIRERLPQNIVVYSPISNGTIQYDDLALLMLKNFIKKVFPNKTFGQNIKAVLCTPLGLSAEEKKAFELTCYKAGIADVCLIPEVPYDINIAARKIEERKKQGKAFSVVVVAEGAAPLGGTITVENIRNNGAGVDNTKLGGVGDRVAKELEALTGLEARNTTLGYMQRGGTPTAFDRVLSTKYGAKAMELAMEEKFGVLTVIKNGKLDYVSLEDVVGNNKQIGAVSGNTAESNIRKVSKEHDLFKTAKNIGICFGE